MTTLREAAQQALEGLEKWQWDKDPRGADAYITALRAALAQQAEPYAAQSAYWAASNRMSVDPVTGNVSIGAQQAEPVEPVAWEGWWLHHGQHNYRAKPLSPERVKELMKLAFEVGREAAPPQQAEPVEPYCYVYEYDGVFGLHREFYPFPYNGMKPSRTVPVYTAPPRQSDPQIEDRLARHGIPKP